MELVLERMRCTKDYTASVLYNMEGKKVYVLDVIEPPVAGLSTRELKALDPGRYKLFLKPDMGNCEIVPVFQSVAQRKRYSFAAIKADTRLDAVDFRSDNKVSKALLQCGRVHGNLLTVEDEAFNRFMISCIICKQHKQAIWVNIK